MTPWLLPAAAAVLAVERACYVWIARAPRSFERWCARPAVAWLGGPVAVVRALFVGFKGLQAAVFLGWWWVLGEGSVLPTVGLAVVAGAALIAAGQVLNVLVFYRLGRVAVFFGDRFGHDVAWCEAFPFSVLRHPQYVGTVLTIWGLFLAVRFPHDDWLLLPVLESVYYAVGARLERDDVPGEPGLRHDEEMPCPRPASGRSG